MRRASLLATAVAFGAVLVVGCSQAGYDMGDMQPPPRPAELDKLAVFLGSWDGSGSVTMAGADEPMKTTGTSTMAWGCDKRILVEHGDYTMGDEGTMKFLGIWTWDSKAGKYRNWWFDSSGGYGEGTTRHDEPTNTWHTKAKSFDAMTGQNTVGEGTTTFTDSSTMDWTWTEWDAWRIKKLMEFKGTSTRK